MGIARNPREIGTQKFEKKTPKSKTTKFQLIVDHPV